MREEKRDSLRTRHQQYSDRRCQNPSHSQGEGLDGVCTRPWQQDGIAPQCAVPELYFDQVAGTSFDEDNQIQYQARRIQFAGESKHLNFREAHFGSSYGWIFDIPEDGLGEVKAR